MIYLLYWIEKRMTASTVLCCIVLWYVVDDGIDGTLVLVLYLMYCITMTMAGISIVINDLLM